MGIAKPSPSASLELLLALTIPISSPFALNRPPPELPADGSAGLDQVHIVALNGNFTVQGADNTIGNGVAQGTQRVANGNGGFANSQAVAVANDSRSQTGGFDFRTATSEVESWPTTVAVYSVPSASCTVMLFAPETTWAQVTM